ncbi:hypothetical protein AALP_AAs55026U000600 [Arabis alpina]|uniref:DUF4283 domain-containing protein n=1 Tax=Arabis alpina TaxID=50452 RepID=A0A087G3H5_ARAAL|nr:hypothetical protein AALP_AAs55026U000600 [Arabis alpina]
MSSQKEIWDALQDLRLGSDQETWKLQVKVHQQFEVDHKLCLVVKGLNPEVQKPTGIKGAMPGIWGLIDKVEGQIQDDGTVNFYFWKEHHMLTVLERAPYTYKGWVVAIGLWQNRMEPNFLRYIPFKIHIEKLPPECRREDIVRDIGKMHGHVTEARVIEPNPVTGRLAKVWVKVDFHVDHKIILVKNVELKQGSEPVELNFRFRDLQKFCTTCGSLQHAFEFCPRASSISTTAEALMFIGTNPSTTTIERQIAIEGIITGQEIGESSNSVPIIPMALAPLADYFIEDACLESQESHPRANDVEIVSPDHGMKRKNADIELEDTQKQPKRQEQCSTTIPTASTSQASTHVALDLKTYAVSNSKGLVAALKPPLEP